MSAAMLTEVAADNNSHHLVDLVFDGGTQYFTTAAYDILWNSNTYTSNGNLLKIGDINESLEMVNAAVPITLSAANQANVSTALSEDFLNRKATIRRAFVNTSHAIVADPLIVFEGKLSDFLLDEDPSKSGTNSTLKWTVGNHFSDFDRKRGRKTNHNSHKLRYSTDDFFEFASESIDNIQWGGKRAPIGGAAGGIGHSSVNISFFENPIKINKRDTNDSISVVYGQRLVEPSSIFKAIAGSNKEFIDYIFILAEGNCDSVVKTVIEGVDSADSRFSGLITHNIFHGGVASPTADATLVTNQTNWTSTHKGSDTCYVYMRFKWDEKVFNNDVDVKFVLKGKKCLEKVLEATAWTDNPAWHIYDYWINSRYGVGVPETEMDEQSFIDAATFYDTATSACGGDDHAIISGGAIIDTNKTLFHNAKALVTGARSWMTFVGGKWKLIVDKDEATTFTFDESNIAPGWKFKSLGKTKRLNRVEVKFNNSNNNLYKEDIHSLESTTFQTEDGGEILEKTYNYPTIDEYCRAGRYAEYLMNRSRFALETIVKANGTSLKVEPGDTVNVEHQTPNWVNTKWRVMKCTLTEGGDNFFTLRLIDSSIYTLPTLGAESTPATNTLPNPSNVLDPTSVSLTTGSTINLANTDGTIIYRIKISWTAAADNFVDGYDVEYKAGSGTWRPVVSRARTTEAFVTGLEVGTEYTLRVRSVNSLGVTGDWVTPSAATPTKNTAIHYKTGFESLDGFTKTVSGGSPSSTIAGDGITLTIGALADIIAFHKKRDFDIELASWDKNRSFKVSGYVTSNAADTFAKGNLTIVMGDAPGASAFVGFSFNGDGNIKSVSKTAAGSQQSNNLVSWSEDTTYFLEAVIDVGVDIKYYVDGVLEYTETTTANIPTGTTDAEVFGSFWLTGQGGSAINVSVSGGIGEFEFFQHE